MHHIDPRHIITAAKEYRWTTGTRLVAYAIAATGISDVKSLCDITGLRKSAVYAALQAIRDYIEARADSANADLDSVYAENVNTDVSDVSAYVENVRTNRVGNSAYVENHSACVENVHVNCATFSAYVENVATKIVHEVNSKNPLLPPSLSHTLSLPPISPFRECSLRDVCYNRGDGNVSSSEKMSDYGNNENIRGQRHENFQTPPLSTPPACASHDDASHNDVVASTQPIAPSDAAAGVTLMRRRARAEKPDPEMPPTPSRAAAPAAGHAAPPARPGATDARRVVTDTWRVWCAYASAYERRYGARPPSSARTNSMCRQLIQRVGIDIALRLAEWYVDARGYYERAMHPLGLLLRDAEVLAAQMQVWPHGLPPRQTIEALAPPTSTTETEIDRLWYAYPDMVRAQGEAKYNGKRHTSPSH